MTKEDFKGLMAEDWLEELYTVLCSKELCNTYAKIREIKALGTPVYPDLKLAFNAFLYTPLSQVRVVICAQDPYHQPNTATGLAFANFDTVGKAMSPSLKTIFDEIEESCYNGLMLNKEPTLVSWARQGVLLLNTALTVEKGKPESHLELWELFTYRVFAVLKEWKPGTIYLLWGNKAKRFIPCIDAERNYILTAPHPAAESYRPGSGFIGCNHFNKVNEIIEKNNGKEHKIVW